MNLFNLFNLFRWNLIKKKGVFRLRTSSRTITTVQGLTLYRHHPTFQIKYLIDPPSHAPRPREPISAHNARHNIVYAA